MTNREEFILVSIIMVLMLGPFALMIGGLLRFSRETYDVLYKPRTFRNSWTSYFLTADILFAFGFTTLGGALLSLLVDLKIGKSPIPVWCTFLILGALIFTLLGIAFYIFYLYANYWWHTKDVVLRFDPEQKTIFINNTSREYVLRNGDIESVDEFTNGHLKLPFAFYRFHIQNQPDLLLTDKTRGVLAIFEYFKNIPKHQHVRWFPKIS